MSILQIVGGMEMQRKPVHEWMILLTYVFVLIIITIHSGYLCKKIVFIGKQFVPLICAGIVALVLHRPYKWICYFYENKINIPKQVVRIFGLMTVYLAIIGTAAAATRFALPYFIEGLQQFIEYREVYVEAFQESVESAFGEMGVKNIDISPFIERISTYLGELDAMLEHILPKMAHVTTGAFKALASVGIVLVLSAYILYDMEQLKKQSLRIFQVFVPERFYEPIKMLLKKAVEVFDNFVAGQSLESVILGTLCFCGMFALRLEYRSFVSIVVGLTAFIPFLGAYIGGGVGTILLLFVSLRKALTFLIFFVILQQVENNFIYPRVVGKRIGLPAIWVLASVTIGGGLFGIAGMILSVPTATFIYILLFEWVTKMELKKNTRQNNKDDI